MRVKRRMHSVSCYNPTKAKFKSQLHVQITNIIQHAMSYENIYISLFKAKHSSSFMGFTRREQCYTTVHEDLFVQLLLEGIDTIMPVRLAARSKA